MKQLIVKYLDLVEHRKFALINKGLEKKEQKCREVRSQMTKDHPEINKKSEKIDARKHSGSSYSRFEMIRKKGQEYEMRLKEK